MYNLLLIASIEFLISITISCSFKGASQVAPVVNSWPANARDIRDAWSISGLGSFPGGRHGNHSRILAWRRPWTEELGGLQFMGSQRVGHDWVTNTHARVHTCTATTPREETTGLNRSFGVLICFPCTRQAQLTALRLLAFPRGGSKPSSLSLPALKSSGGPGLLREDAGNG